MDGVLQQNEPLKIQWWLNEGTEAMGEKTWKKKTPTKTNDRTNRWLAGLSSGARISVAAAHKKTAPPCGQNGFGALDDAYCEHPMRSQRLYLDTSIG